MRKANPDRVIRDIGRRVAELRVACSLTQDELSELAGLSLKYIQRIEAGRENLTIRSLVGLANLLRVPVRDLLTPPVSRAVRRGRPPGRLSSRRTKKAK